MQNQLPLKTAIWVYDIEEHLMLWANESALLWWQANSVQEINDRNFSDNMSDAVKSGLLEYKKKFEQGETFAELWQFSPAGVNKQAFCQFSGVQIQGKDDQQKLAMLVEATPSGLVAPLIGSDVAAIFAIFDENGIIQSCNPPFKSEFGLAVTDIRAILSSPKDFASIRHETKKTGRLIKDIQLHTEHGLHWFQATVSYSVQSNDVPCLLFRLYNIDERKRTELDLLEKTQTDNLTGLLNRTGLATKLKFSIQTADPFHLFYIDLDGFKMINDSLGHSIGDDLLTEVSARLQKLSIPNSHICRFGGDEFVLTAGGHINNDLAAQYGAYIVDTLSKPYYDKHNNLLTISASVGYSVFPKDSERLNDIVRFADAAMYVSKKRGKKRWTQFVTGMETAILRKSIVAQHLSVAIKNHELSLHFQPIVNVKDDSIHSFEALLRWYNHDLGQVSPQELIGVAEDIGLIEEIEHWVIETAISSLHELRARTNSDAAIAINVSATHFSSPKLPYFLLKVIRTHNLKPSDIIIEITESVLLDGLEVNNAVLDKITELGMHLSIDDFGTGYSSLAYLHNIEASIVKIDRAFQLNQNGSGVTLKAIQNLIHSLGMTALVEGVETQQQSTLCKEIGIGLHQGYFYAKPKALDKF